MKANDVFNYFPFPSRTREILSNRYIKELKKIWGGVSLNEHRNITNQKKVDVKFNIIEIKMK